VAEIKKLEAEIYVVEHIGNIRGCSIKKPLSLSSKDYMLLIKNLRDNNVDIHKETSKKTIKYEVNNKEKTATTYLDSKIIKDYTLSELNLRAEKGIELILSNYEKVGSSPRLIGGSQSADYGIKCIVRMNDVHNLSNVVLNVKKALETTYESMGKPMFDIDVGKFGKISSKNNKHIKM
jgi:hypothetical protein